MRITFPVLLVLHLFWLGNWLLFWLESLCLELAALVEHRIWIFDCLYAEFLAVEWYDKPMACNACYKQLLELKTISHTTPLTILSKGLIVHINSPLEFCVWLKNVFEAGQDYGFSRRIFLEKP